MLIPTFATAAHNSIFSVILGLPFERAMFWHAWFASLATIAAIYHGLLIFMIKSNPIDSYNWAVSPNAMLAGENKKKDNIQHRRLDGDGDGDNIGKDVIDTGLIATVAMIFMVSYSSINPLRRKFFEFFYYLHVLLASE